MILIKDNVEKTVDDTAEDKIEKLLQSGWTKVKAQKKQAKSKDNKNMNETVEEVEVDA